MCIRKIGIFGTALLALIFTGAPLAKGPKLKPEELITRHLQSVGSAERLANRQGSVAEGEGRVTLLVGGTGSLVGPATFLSSGRGVSLLLDFGHAEYAKEHIVFNGEEANTAFIRPGQRSPLGEFLFTYTGILKEGLLGSVLSTAWPLFEVEARRPKLKYRGLKKVGDRELLELDYRPRRGGRDTKIKLYFNPETLHHVLTTYAVSISAGLGATSQQSAQLRRTYLKLKERFGDFRELNGLTLPTRWELEFSREGTQEGLLWKWEMNYSSILQNQKIDGQKFKLR